ncbi:hypothetical protein PILCRDRAFT_468226 [Piloderma croceum F 1598]|uniref:Uncharacterized protein n=1 Tax=Piloderma croceum (strain F 1598) TaxID=765440 RepID=A0A0C3BZ24_PILCF|nr:hypothetical protein PILCRDRAFT_468226 [Piloderma croceum F 1598]
MAPTTPTNAQRLYKALHRKYRSERVPITDVVLQIKENAKIHNDSLGRKHEKMIEEAIAAATWPYPGELGEAQDQGETGYPENVGWDEAPAQTYP